MFTLRKLKGCLKIFQNGLVLNFVCVPVQVMSRKTKSYKHILTNHPLTAGNVVVREFLPFYALRQIYFEVTNEIITDHHRLYAHFVFFNPPLVCGAYPTK